MESKCFTEIFTGSKNCLISSECFLSTSQLLADDSPHNIYFCMEEHTWMTVDTGETSDKQIQHTGRPIVRGPLRVIMSKYFFQPRIHHYFLFDLLFGTGCWHMQGNLMLGLMIEP
ncbi:unnamed protein product [Vicia faba]|uniref:Uncharacterized protein n=1 Tax=Vicia faba TaxID=3906 RepID=A0AAV1A9E4_VICFA|nr:unnamed protein product [Vicia faba]